MSDSNDSLFRSVKIYCKSSAIVVFAISCIVLYGWAFQIEILKTIVPGLVTMKANTAVGLAFSAISLWLLLPGESRGVRGRVARFLALLVTLIGAGTLFEYVFGSDLRIDQLLFNDPKGSLGTSSPGRLAPMTATAFIALGLALIWLDRKWRRGSHSSQILSLWAWLIAMLAINGYIFRAMVLYKLLLYTQVAAHTASALLLLSAAIFFARPHTGFAGDLMGEGSGSTMARRFLPAVFLIPVFLGWICLHGELQGLYGPELGLALYSTSTTIVLAFLVWMSARKMNVEYDSRSAAQDKIRSLNATLESRVAERTRTLEQQSVVLTQQAALLDLAHDAIIVRDMHNRIEFWNRGAELMYGWPAALAIGKIQYELLKAELSQPIEEIEAELMREGHWEGEMVHYTRAGDRLNVDARWALQRDSKGKPARILAIYHDITERKKADTALREGEERFRNLANNMSQLAWMADETGYIFWYNNRWFDYTGTTLEEMKGWGWEKVHDPEHVQRVVEKIAKCFQTGEVWEDTFPLRGRDGIYRPFLSRAVPIRDATGKVLRWFGTNTDVSESKALEEALFEEKERAQVTLNSIGDAVICTDIEGRITFLNLVAEKMTGWPRQEADGRPMPEVFEVLDANSREVIPNPMALAVGENRTMNLPANCILIQRRGVEIPIEDSVSPIHDRQGKVTGAVIVFRDVSAARAMTLQMTHSAQHDFLTGLPNRMLLSDRIRQAIVFAPRHNKKVGILFLDLDGFKHINDSLGHPVGDLLLQSVGRRLTECVRGSDTVSRQGGDEFVVLLSEMAQPEDAAITARRMLATVAAPHSIGGHDLHVTTSIGVSVYPFDGADAETLIKNADTAMYQAKEHGRQSYQFFKPAMNVRAVERQSIEESLRRAVERQEFALHYQPKINLKTGEIAGAEALLRWTHPSRGLVPPSQFIPVAEDCGLILPIGRWVLREACTQAQAWLRAGLPLVTMAVNISAMEFRDDCFLDSVLAILWETELDPARLELELTETVLMKRAESAETILGKLREKGVRLAVDDFGTGYSSLSYLRKFPIDALKIDQSFIRQITTSPGETSIVTAIISMGRSLKLRVVAEGVETSQELAFLQAHQCDEAQGYLFSRPVAPGEFAKLLETGIAETVPH
jgi:diguanylate cyclase (GGDEF)-like protein/PAS domain S-box-containing protein